VPSVCFKCFTPAPPQASSLGAARQMISLDQRSHPSANLGRPTTRPLSSSRNGGDLFLQPRKSLRKLTQRVIRGFSTRTGRSRHPAWNRVRDICLERWVEVEINNYHRAGDVALSMTWASTMALIRCSRNKDKSCRFSIWLLTPLTIPRSSWSPESILPRSEMPRQPHDKNIS